MNAFALGMATACLITTAKGREIIDKVGRVAGATGSKFLKNELGIDVKSILNTPPKTESEEIKNEP